MRSTEEGSVAEVLLNEAVVDIVDDEPVGSCG